MLLAAVLAMSVMMAAPATVMADDFDGDGFEDFVEEFCEDFDGDDFCDDDEDFDEFGFFVVEIDDVDCDGFDDDFDGGIDEDVVCVVEFEVEDFDGFDSNGDGFDVDFD
jgi:hypothetical protein